MKWTLARTKRKRKLKFYIKSLILILNYSLVKKNNINMKWRWGWRSFLLLYNYLKQAFWPMGLFLWNSNDKTKFTSPTEQTRRIQNGNWLYLSNVHLVCLINAMMYNPFNWNVQLTWNVTIIFCIVPNLKTTAINGNELQTEHNRGSKWWVIKKLIIQNLFWVVSISVHIIIDRDTIRWRNMQLLFFFSSV